MLRDALQGNKLHVPPYATDTSCFRDRFHERFNITVQKKDVYIPQISISQLFSCRCASQGVWEYPEVPEKGPVPAMLS